MSIPSMSMSIGSIYIPISFCYNTLKNETL